MDLDFEIKKNTFPVVSVEISIRMEQTVVSGPGGHTDWDSEPPSPLRFVSLDTDKGGSLPPNTTGQTGLDFKTVDQDKAPPTIGDVFQENPKLQHFSSLISLSHSPDIFIRGPSCKL